jgi:hypothetical protein
MSTGEDEEEEEERRRIDIAAWVGVCWDERGTSALVVL